MRTILPTRDKFPGKICCLIIRQPDQQKDGFGSLFQNESLDVLYQGDWKGDNFHGSGLLQNFAFEEGIMQCNPEDFSNISHIWKNYQGEFIEGLMSGKG